MSETYSETVFSRPTSGSEYGMATGLNDDAVVYRFRRLGSAEDKELSDSVRVALNGGVEAWRTAAGLQSGPTT